MKWVTLFPNCYNENLMKDVGLIPYFMNKEHNINSYIVTFETDKFKYLEKEVKGLKHITIKNRGRLISQLLFTIKNAKRIDVLNLYHWGRVTLLTSILYKLLNRKGKLYVKLDMDLNGVSVINNNKHARRILGKITKTADLVSVESKRICENLNKYYDNRVVYIPNGMYSTEVTIQDKEKLILTVGRLGTKQKATEVLLEAFSRIQSDIPEWKLVLIGSIEPDFRKYIDTYFDNNPKLKERVLFKGHISDRKSLNYYYEKASVFALPSRWESFALVLLEAMINGCYVITTEGISPVYDLIKSKKIGEICKVDDIDEFSEKLKTICNSSIDYENIRKSVEKDFSWSNICKIIHMKLNI